MAKSREELRREMEEIEENLIQNFGDLNPEELVLNDEDLPEIEDVHLTDYEGQIREHRDRGEQVIDNLVRLYLNDSKELINHAYIKRKRAEDTDNYSKLTFLVQSSERSLVSILRDIEMGNTQPRMYEVLSLLQKEMRENIKLASTTLSQTEKFYKTLREDLGINSPLNSGESEENKEKKTNTSMRELNDKIDLAIKSRSE